MKIYGLGIDIVNINRIKSIMNKNENFKKRIFTQAELNYCSKKKDKYSCFAKRFAAKESFAKALGIGISKGIKFKELEVKNNKYGKPDIKVICNSKKIVKKILKNKKYNVLLSLSDDKPFAMAKVIIVIK